MVAVFGDLRRLFQQLSMLRPSVAPSRASHAPGSLNSHEYAAAAAQRLAEKKKEYEAVAALEAASNLLLQRMAGISEDFDVMADAGRGKTPSRFRPCRTSLISISSWTGPRTMA